MRDLSTITNKEAIQIGNMAFRKHKKFGYEDLYQSKKWKLHICLDRNGKTGSVLIVDEKEPLAHIDNLFYDGTEDKYSHQSHLRVPMFNHIEITKELVVRHYIKTDLSLLLIENSQYSIF